MKEFSNILKFDVLIDVNYTDDGVVQEVEGVCDPGLKLSEPGKPFKELALGNFKGPDGRTLAETLMEDHLDILAHKLEQRVKMERDLKHKFARYGA